MKTTHKPLYALAPIRVRGRLYRAGQVIENPGGSREPLLAFGQASETPPHAAPPETDEETDPDSLAALGLSATIRKALAKLGIEDVPDLLERVDPAHTGAVALEAVETLDGLGPKQAQQIVDALASR